MLRTAWAAVSQTSDDTPRTTAPLPPAVSSASYAPLAVQPALSTVMKTVRANFKVACIRFIINTSLKGLCAAQHIQRAHAMGKMHKVQCIGATETLRRKDNDKE